MSERSRGLAIHFTDGKTMKLEFPKQTLNDWGAVIKIKEVLGQPHLLAEVDGALLIFPYANIKYIVAYPAPSQLPEQTIKGATIAGD